MGPKWQTSQIQLNLLNLQAKWHTQRLQESSKELSKDKEVGGSPAFEMILPLISIWNHPAPKTIHTTFHPNHHIHPLLWHIFCGLCFFLNLNKSTSYLSLCLSLNFYPKRYQEPELLGPEPRHRGFWPGSSPSPSECVYTSTRGK